MGEDHGLVAVEIIDDPVIIGRFQQLHAHHTVVAHTADHQPVSGGNGTHRFDVPADQCIPCVRHLPQHHLVQRFKGNAVGFLLEFFRNPLPESEKTVLQCIVIEESAPIHILLQRVEGIAVALMQINQHIQIVFPAPCQTIAQIVKSAFQRVPRLILQNIVIHRHTDMVKAKAGNVRNIRLCDKRPEMRRIIHGELGNPAAQIDTLLESFKASHRRINLPYYFSFQYTRCIFPLQGSFPCRPWQKSAAGTANQTLYTELHMAACRTD